MKFSSFRKDLLEAMVQIVNIIEKRQTIQILSNMYLSVSEDNVLLMRGTDMEIEGVIQLPVVCLESGNVTVPARTLLDICRQLPDDSQIVIEQIDDTVRLLSGRSRFKLNTLPAENFPAFSQIEAELSVELPASTLQRLFSKPLFSVAQQDVRTFLNGLLLEIEGQQIRTVGSDGHRLTLCEDQLTEAVPQDVSLLIPRKGVVELSKLFKDHNTTVRLDISRSFIAVHSLNSMLSVKLIDDQYPIYRSVIPTDFTEHAQFNTRDFKDVVARVAVMTGDVLSSVELHFENNVLNINSRSVDQEEAEDSIDIQFQGEPFTIGFKCSYLADLANNINSDEMRMSFPADKSSLLTSNPDDDLVKYVLSPVRI